MSIIVDQECSIMMEPVPNVLKTVPNVNQLLNVLLAPKNLSYKELNVKKLAMMDSITMKVPVQLALKDVLLVLLLTNVLSAKMLSY